MNEETDLPAWLATARAAWPRGATPSGLDAKWSPYWINKFLVYVKARNGGKLPERCPRPGLADAFCRFIGTQWGVEDWKVEQARGAAEWLLEAGGSEERRADKWKGRGICRGGPEGGNPNGRWPRAQWERGWRSYGGRGRCGGSWRGGLFSVMRLASCGSTGRGALRGTCRWR